MSNDLYTCNICGDKFETYAKIQIHQQLCGVSKLDEFTDSKTSGTSNASIK